MKLGLSRTWQDPVVGHDVSETVEEVLERPELVGVPSGQGQQQQSWWLVEQLVEAAVELGARAAWAQAAGTEGPGHWAEAVGARQMQQRVWLELQVLEEVVPTAEVLKGEGHWEEDPGAGPAVWPGQVAQVGVLLDGCLEWAVEPQDEPQGWVWEHLGGTEGEGDSVGAY